jgi:predicted ATP-dependent endonuclease of OLD family
MKIFKIQVENYRLLKDFSIDIEEELSLVIGKNNTGKTSLLLVLEKFLNSPNSFKFDDFNIEFKKEIKELLEAGLIAEEEYKPKSIKLKIFIGYGEDDDLSNISRVMMDLDPENNVIVLGFEFALHFANYERMKSELIAFNEKEAQKKAENGSYKEKNTWNFIEQHLSFFKPRRYSFEYIREENQADENVFVDLDDEKISVKDIISFKYISARRDVTNKEADKTLSGQTSQIYERTEENDEQSKAIEDFKDQLIETDDNLSSIYTSLFEDIVKKVELFGGIKPNESEIKIISSLQHRNLLIGNTTVIYNHDADNQLPEYYNGLGYMNLISMIFEIEIKRQEFKGDKNKKPSDINLLFIEEPEAHTHPQMQYVFIKNIKSLLKDGIAREDGQNRKLQYIISTHSSHIVADSEFDDIKYLKKISLNNVIAKSLRELSLEYEEAPNQYQFLKQYLTISRAEIFFADKAVLIEGDTERILLPTMMKKIDIEEKQRHHESGENDPFLPLLSQNISIIEVGAYSQIFEKFIEFLGIKSLIITDLDAVDADGEKCGVQNGVSFSNTALSFFFNNKTLDDLKGYDLNSKILKKGDGIWANDPEGNLLVVYQTNENGYNARSFEDSFIHLNKEFVRTNKDDFKGLKNRNYFDNDARNAYSLANECIKKKTHFALDILFFSNANLSNWQIPKYIKEGLLWLKED